ncbi:MAG: hypothetical protein DWQ07_15860 [Chloroflexi bacterium]|nr:MAG: hypothetical protein DWQ07_15860 [Chloroflexota bacterium]MBL1195226.1 hypothetical protein [Chloroflexota bacterium]NOH12511.1 hypothetical protein [Chloroflexota bacterium]
MKAISKHLIVLLAVGLAGCTALGTPVPTATLQPTPTEDQLVLAEDTLVTFFELLNEGDYEIAIQLQGGPPEFIEELQIFNPDVDPMNFAGLFKSSCETQFLCLKVKRVVSGEQVSEDEFRFVVEFEGEDGETFFYGPCCGADPTEEPPFSEFEYTVVRINGRLRVLRGPIYVP